MTGEPYSDCSSRRQPRRKVLCRRRVDLDHAHGHVRQRTALEIDQTARDRRIVGDELEAVAVGVVNGQLFGPGWSITFRKCGEEHACGSRCEQGPRPARSGRS